MATEQSAVPKVRLVQKLNHFQRMIYHITRELRNRGYDSDGATPDRVLRIISTVPVVRGAADEMGYEHFIPADEVNRVVRIVQQNMVFQERPMFVFNDLMDIEVVACAHGAMLYCEECRRERGHNQPDGRRY